MGGSCHEQASRRRPTKDVEPGEPADAAVIVESTGESQSASAAGGSEGVIVEGQEGAEDEDSVLDDDDGDVEEDEGYDQEDYFMEDRDMKAAR